MNNQIGNVALFFGWVLISIAYGSDFPQYIWAKALLFILLMISICWGTLRYGGVIKNPASPVAKILMANKLMMILLFDKKIYLTFQNNDNLSNMLVLVFFVCCSA